MFNPRVLQAQDTALDRIQNNTRPDSGDAEHSGPLCWGYDIELSRVSGYDT